MLTFSDILAARERLAPFVPTTPLRNYASLDQAVGSDITVFVKHENHLPTNSFKYRNGLLTIASERIWLPALGIGVLAGWGLDSALTAIFK